MAPDAMDVLQMINMQNMFFPKEHHNIELQYWIMIFWILLRSFNFFSALN